MAEVIIHDDENFERALKRFKKKCEKAGILSPQAPALREAE
jgi:small subunit ribosomal protein S21